VARACRAAPHDKMTAYERLLGDSIRSDATLFVRQDSVEARGALSTHF
jgi:glucose-6-phosphate 1-dehydrogenase